MRLFARLLGLVAIILIIALWEFVTVTGTVSPQALPSASAVGKAAFRELWEGDLGSEMLVTIRRILFGYGWACVIAIPLGIALGRSRILFTALSPIMEFLRPMPVVAVLPILIFFLGLGDRMTFTMIAIGSGWYVLFNTIDGIRGVDPVLEETGRTFQVSKPRQLWTIFLPAAAPQIFTGLRLALGIAVIITILVEMASGFGGGVGSYIAIAGGSFQLPEAYAGICMVALIGYTASRLFLIFEQNVMSWHIKAGARNK